MLKARALFVLMAVLLLAALTYWFLIRSPYPAAESALEAFYGGESRPECMQAAPLHWDGSRVVPLVVRELPNKAMPRRRYAISFLGEGRYAEALPVLERILSDVTEIDYFRADALLAIYEISPTRARSLAPQVQNPSGLLGTFIQAIEHGDRQVRNFINHDC